MPGPAPHGRGLGADAYLHLAPGGADIGVTRGQMVALNYDSARLERLWFTECVPELIAAEARRHPPVERLVTGLRGPVEVTALPIPLGCVDGLTEAY